MNLEAKENLRLQTKLGWHVKQAGSDPSHYNLIFRLIALDIGCPIKWNRPTQI